MIIRTGTNHNQRNLETINSSSKSQKNVVKNISEDKRDGNVAVAYQRSSSNVVELKTYKRYNATVTSMIEESERRSQEILTLVEKLLIKQGHLVDDSTDIYGLLREGKVEVDPETRAQAQKDIAEDGYWGVEKTSDRLVSFALAISGGDPSKADEAIKAVQKGFEEAERIWGGALPSICKETIDVTIRKLKEWRDGHSQPE